MTPPRHDDGLMTGLAGRDLDDDTDTGRTSDKNYRNLRLLFFISILVQVVDVFLFQFDRTIFLQISIAMYLFLTILALIFFHKKGEFINFKNIIVFTLISAFYIIIPFLLWAVPDINVVASTTLADWVHFLIAILPIWPIYIGLKARIPFVHKYVNFWILFLFILFIFGVGFNLSIGSLPFTNPTFLQAGVVVDYLVQETREVGVNVWNAVTGGWTVFVNQSGMGWYTSQIEGNEKAHIGLYLDNVRLMSRYNYVGAPVVIWADISGQSFVDDIVVTPSCFIDKVGPGERDRNVLYIRGLQYDSFSCTFYDLPKGSYYARVGANFNFETWAYVTYTFVDNEFMSALARQGKNINYELDIDPYLKAVCTNGPVVLGMASPNLQMPIGIDTRYNLFEPIIGFSLTDRPAGSWSEGKIADVEEIILMVPNVFKLVDCDVWRPDKERPPFKTEDDIDYYRFAKEDLMDPRLEFNSVTCRLHIKDDKIDTFLAGAEKVQKTFVAQAKYTYNLEKGVRFTVRE